MKRVIKANYVRLPLKKAYNVRDLGGYAGTGRKQTRFHAFLRTDNLSDITQEDKDFLKAYGVRAVLDLRGEAEAQKYPNPLQYDPEICYLNIPFITDEIMDLRKIRITGFHVPNFYRDLLESYELVCRIMNFIAAQKGCVLFHCMAGKDRTGVVAMLLLGLCGVSKEDIIANYQVTRTYLKDYVTLNLEDEIRELEFSKPEWMEETYDYLIHTYGSVEAYLQTAGLSKKTIKKLKKKLL